MKPSSRRQQGSNRILSYAYMEYIYYKYKRAEETVMNASEALEVAT